MSKFWRISFFHGLDFFRGLVFYEWVFCEWVFFSRITRLVKNFSPYSYEILYFFVDFLCKWTNDRNALIKTSPYLQKHVELFLMMTPIFWRSSSQIVLYSKSLIKLNVLLQAVYYYYIFFWHFPLVFLYLDNLLEQLYFNYQSTALLFHKPYFRIDVQLLAESAIKCTRIIQSFFFNLQSYFQSIKSNSTFNSRCFSRFFPVFGFLWFLWFLPILPVNNTALIQRGLITVYRR